MKTNITITGNRKRVAAYILAAVAAFGFAVSLIAEYENAQQYYPFTSGDPYSLITGILCAAAGAYALYTGYIVNRQHIEIIDTTVTGTGLEDGLLNKEKNFTYAVSDIRKIDVASRRGFGKCVELHIQDHGVAAVCVQNPQEAADALRAAIEV